MHSLVSKIPIAVRTPMQYLHHLHKLYGNAEGVHAAIFCIFMDEIDQDVARFLTGMNEKDLDKCADKANDV